MRFLFWNTQKKPLGDRVARLAASQRADVVLLAEPPTDTTAVLTALNHTEERGGYSRAVGVGTSPVDAYVRFPASWLTPALDAPQISVRKLAAPGQDEILLAMVHLRSPLHRDARDPSFYAREAARRLRNAETDAGHQRTIVVGDFNYDPFDAGMLGADGFHAVPTREIALRGSRTVNHEERPFFYNPLWSQFGDRSPGPPGTCYRSKGDPVTQFWHLYDQVLIRPSLIHGLDQNSVEVLSTDGSASLAREGQCGEPDAEAASDHFPIVFEVRW